MSSAGPITGGFATTRTQRAALGVVALILLVVLWDLLVRFGLVASFLLPPPLAVLAAFPRFAGALAAASRVTLLEVLAGFGLAVGVALLLAMGLTYSRVLNAMLYPPLVALQAVPKIAIAPLLIIWFGFGIGSKVVVAFLIALFPLVVQTAAGLRSVEPQLHDLSRVYGASWLRTFRKIDFPHALPHFFAGLRVGVTLAMTGAIVAEFLAADAGLGFLLQSAVSQHLMALAFAAVTVIAALSLVLFGGVVLLERLLVPWGRPEEREAG